MNTAHTQLNSLLGYGVPGDTYIHKGLQTKMAYVFRERLSVPELVALSQGEIEPVCVGMGGLVDVIKTVWNPPVNRSGKESGCYTATLEAMCYSIAKNESGDMLRTPHSINVPETACRIPAQDASNPVIRKVIVPDDEGGFNVLQLESVHRIAMDTYFERAKIGR